MIIQQQEEMEPPQAATPSEERTDSPINIYVSPEDYPSILSLNLFGTEPDQDQTDAMEIQTFPPTETHKIFPFMEAHGPNRNIFYYQNAHETPMELDD